MVMVLMMSPLCNPVFLLLRLPNPALSDAGVIDSSREDIVQILPSNTVEEMDSNAQRIAAWIGQQQGGR